MASDPEAPTLVVGVGASAGGLDALERVFGGMPLDTGAAFVVVQHLSPDHRSLMDELLARFTRLPIVVVDAPMRLRRDTIFLLPPNRELEVDVDRLVPFERPIERVVASPINRFLVSLGRAVGERAVAIVLSGTGSDGSLGVRAVHDAGGLVAVQDPVDAKFDGMPRAALATGVVDVVAPAEQLAGLVARVAAGDERGGQATGTLGGAFDLLRERMYQVSGIDFRLYKPATLLRRIQRRAEALHSASPSAYCESALVDPEEIEHLVRDALIGVTRFFRDTAAFEALRLHAVPELIARGRAQGELRVWVPACSTGEEAYSLAMLLIDALADYPEVELRVLATDVQRDALRVASDAIYEAAALVDVPPPLRERYFVAEIDGRYRIAASVRRRVLVSAHNLLRDIPFNRIDLVSCRNLLIYLSPEGQARALGAFAFALRAQGWLLLGSAESVSAPSTTFETVDSTSKLFRKVGEGRGLTGLASVPGRGTEPPRPPSMMRMGPVYEQLLERFVPTGVLVNERREQVHVFGDAGRYLRLPTGRATLELPAMCEGELRSAVSVALGEAARRGEPVAVHHVALADGRVLDVEAIPLGTGPTDRRHQLVAFRAVGVPGPAPAAPEVVVADDRVQLEVELREARASFAAMLQSYEAATEELQASNEELVAGNEELQSVNEELQSVNEELHSVNAEYTAKIQALAALEADLRNLIEVSHAGVVFTDEALRVRLFTPGSTAILNLMSSDVGRPLGHITSRVPADDLLGDLAKVQASMAPIEALLQAPDGRAFRRRVQPYRDADGRPGGYVVTFTDVTEQHRVAEVERRHAALVNAVLDASPSHLAVLDRAGVIIATNRAWDVFGVDNGGRPGRFMVGTPYRAAAGDDVDDTSRAMSNAIDSVLAGRQASADVDYRCDTPSEERWFWMNVRAIAEPFGGAVVAHTDITARKRATALEEKLHEAARLESLGVLAGGVAHDFNNILTGILANVSLMRLDQPPGGFVAPLAEVQQAAERAAQLCNQLLTYAGRARVVKAPVHVASLISDTRALIRASLARGAVLDLAGVDDALWVEGDVGQLQQVVMNLIINASEALASTGGMVRVSATAGAATVRPDETEVVAPTAPDGPHVCIEVSDDGCGIDRALQSRIFEPFYTSKFAGRGLGLAAALGTVRSHGGGLFLWSQPGLGTRFRVVLPRVSKPVLPMVVAPASPSPRPVASPLEVLVVDDEDAVRQVLVRILDRFGYRPAEVADGAAAIALVTASPERFAALVLDMTMPGVDGVAVLAAVRRIAPTVKVVMTSGFAESDLLGQLGADQPNAFIQKPMDASALARVLDAVLHR